MAITSRSQASTIEIDSMTGEAQNFTEAYQARVFGQGFYDNSFKQVNAVKEVSPYLSGLSKDDALWVPSGGFNSSVTYDSNVSQSYNDAKDDVTHTYAALWGISRKARKTFLSTFYRIGASRFIETSKSNEVNHTVTSQFSYRNNRFKAELSNNFAPARTYDTGIREELDVNDRKRVYAITDALVLDLHYTVSPKTELLMGSGYELMSFPTHRNSESEAVNAFSTNTYRLQPSVVYRWTPRTKLSAGFQWQHVEFYENGGLSSTSYLPQLSVSTALGRKTQAGASLGYRWRVYADSDNVPQAESPVFNAGLYRQITPKLGGSLYYSWDQQEDFTGITGQSLKQVAQYLGVTAGYYLSTHMDLTADAGVSFLSKEGYVELVDIENPIMHYTRPVEDETFRWSVSWRWRPRKFLSVVLGYRFENKNSTFKDFEFEDQRVTASMDSRF